MCGLAWVYPYFTNLVPTNFEKSQKKTFLVGMSLLYFFPSKNGDNCIKKKHRKERIISLALACRSAEE